MHIRIFAFKGVPADVLQATDVVRFRLAWWFKNYGRGSKEQITLMLLNIKDCCVDPPPSKRSSSVSWRPPMAGFLSFNVDGSARGSPGPAGMGGELRDSNGKVLCLYSCFLGTHDSNYAEIMAIRKACDLCISNQIPEGSKITIVSDSKVAVSWVKNGDFGSLAHVNIIYDIRSTIASQGNMDVIFNPRSTNSFADMLAKKGSSLKSDFVFWNNT